MIDHTANALYLLKADNSEVFGPVTFQQVNTWAAAAQISPLDKVSTDQQTWFKAPMVPELQMDWLIELTSDQLYGPTTLGAIQEFLNLSEINADTKLINARDGNSYTVKDIDSLVIPPEEPEDAESSPDEPVRTGIRVTLQQRIRELESTLFEERRTREALEERYAKLEAKYVEIVKQRP